MPLDVDAHFCPCMSVCGMGGGEEEGGIGIHFFLFWINFLFGYGYHNC